MPLSRRLASEFLGTAFLLAAVVGSGIMGERLENGNVAIALLANSIATGAALVCLILSFGPISGAHFNPVVTLASAIQSALPWKQVPPYIAAQLLGAFTGVAAADKMFSLPTFFLSHHARSGSAQIFSEATATIGLLLIIFLCSRSRATATPYAIAAYITSAYWFTSSTSFANPAVTLARSVSDTFAGIRPNDVPGFLLGQLMGLAMAIPFMGWLLPKIPNATPQD